MVGVRQQQVKGRWGELEQRLVRGHRVALGIDRAQDAAVAVHELRRAQQIEAVGHRIEAIAAIGVQAVPPGCLGVPVEADAYLDPEALQRREHRPVEEGSVGLEGHVHSSGHVRTKGTDQAGQPLGPREQRLAAVQDDVHARKVVLCRVLGNALHGFADHGGAHSLRQSPPALIRHFIHIAVRAGQIATTMDFQDKLPKRNRLMSRSPDFAHVQVEYRPRCWMLGLPRPRH